MIREHRFFRFVVVLALCVMAFSGPKTASASEKILRVGVTSFADTLEPTTQYFSWVVSRYGVGECLVRFDEKGGLKPCLAESWRCSDDKKSWIFRIREGVKFSNGREMTPELVKASLERTFTMSKRAATAFFKYDSIEVDGQNLIITTSSPTYNVPGSLAEPLFLIVDTTVDTESFALEGPICTGPYKVVSFKASEICVVARNDHYWGGPVPFDKVEYKVIGDQVTREMALQAGEIDVAYNLKSGNAATFTDESRYSTLCIPALRTTLAFMNQKGFLGDKILRQAIIRALDRDTYVEVLLDGGATAGKTPVPPSLDFGFEDIEDPNSFDPDSARKILTDNGYKDIDGDGYVESPNGEKIDLNFVIYDSRAELGIYAQAAQINLKEVGIKVTVNTVSYETMLDKQEAGDFDLIIWCVLAANTGDPENYLREFWRTYSNEAPNSNKAGYSNSEVDRLMDELSTEFDPTKRRDLVIDIQRHIVDDAASVFFGCEVTYLFSSSKVTGLKIYPIDYYWITKDVDIAD
ncbi:ABC transporter substrate-binding protein [Dethiosulfovibrio sp. F2B]|uniref:ABC transporter substrate-binding protein n=1 Tax=Dethiosulfovibrio faecalis TaxID=2720018 RepID=UPI001F48C0D8|nr:ABC transporter substrate-binding protein [Dethiosulfovibrio faecalis]MCF4150576.1 ABC transporter substrate-binding protein [Dethiosulfovibrio faecalis]